MKTKFKSCCNQCGEKLYAKYKPFKEFRGNTMTAGCCSVCGKVGWIIYAIDWEVMCNKNNTWSD